MTKYRVWVVINPPNIPDYYPVDNPKMGAEFIRQEIENQSDNPYIEANAFGLEVSENGTEFSEWYNDMGEDVCEAFDL
jgi:hypothetical protein